LNARASILAAANPVFGRYDRSKPLKANVAVSAPIMSRFDLFFIIVDESDPELDEAIARHIVDVHRSGGKSRAAASASFSMEQLQKYIRFARTLNPRFTPASQKKVVECYRLLRQQDIMGGNKSAYRITVRQLESLIRLSEALARLHLDTEVQSAYVLEALRLLQKSIILVESSDVVLEENEEAMDAERNYGNEGDENHENSHNDEGGDGDDGDGGGYPDDQQPYSDEGVYPEAATDQITGRKRAHDEGNSYAGTSEREQVDAKVKEEEEVSGGRSKKDKKKTKISMEVYREVTQIVIVYLKKLESADQSLDYKGCKWRDIESMYLNMDLDYASGDVDREKLIYLVTTTRTAVYTTVHVYNSWQ
jgi:DNA replication licensing factor MCM6